MNSAFSFCKSANLLSDKKGRHHNNKQGNLGKFPNQRRSHGDTNIGGNLIWTNCFHPGRSILILTRSFHPDHVYFEFGKFASFLFDVTMSSLRWSELFPSALIFTPSCQLLCFRFCFMSNLYFTLQMKT